MRPKSPDPIFRITSLLAFAAVSILMGHSPLLAQAPASTTRQVLWYRSPAPVWDHALPVGNGRLGAMVFGGANSGPNNGDLQDAQKNASLMDGSQTYAGDEHLQLNESSLWQGSRANRLNPGAHHAFPQRESFSSNRRGRIAQRFPPPKSLPRMT